SVRRAVGAGEAGGGLRAPGDSVHLSCRGSGFGFGNFAVRWYHETPGGGLEWASFISGSSSTTKYRPAVEGRAMASQVNSRSEFFLFLSALQPQDSARYFCAIHTK
ncbi:HV03 protein, partial [Phaetusa simplex]|nr:HV03 protein [Phaetusa simplex]